MNENRTALLAERHRKVLRLYGQRYRLKEIARELSLSENSVNTHPLRSMEDQIDRAIADNAHVTLSMIDARQRTGLAAGEGHGLLHRNLEIGAELGRLRGATVELHADCLEFLKSKGLAERMYGDQWDCGAKLF